MWIEMAFGALLYHGGSAGAPCKQMMRLRADGFNLEVGGGGIFEGQLLQDDSRTSEPSAYFNSREPTEK